MGHSISRSGIISHFVEVIWCVTGIGEARLFDRAYQLRENDVFYYMPGEDHCLTAFSETWSYRWLCFRGRLAEATMLSYAYPRHQTASNPYPEGLFGEIEGIVSLTDLLSQRRGAALILEALARMGGEDGSGVHSGRTVRRCIEYILSNLADPNLGLPALSRLVGVAPSTLGRLFKEETEVSPGRYILDRRLGQAVSLLRGTDLPVGEIAVKCGFADRRTFARFIRRSCGHSPNKYRQHLRAAEK